MRFACLSNNFKQAQAVGASLSGTQFTAIHSSPLKRAYMTAQAVHSQQNAPPPLTTSLLLREQHFGVAEGKASTSKRNPSLSLEEHFDKGIYPGFLDKADRFPGGESLEDVQVRAGQVWEDILLPYLWQARESGKPVHVAVISHGIFIKQALRALGKYDQNIDLTACDYQWLRNTAFARVVVGVKVRHHIKLHRVEPQARITAIPRGQGTCVFTRHFVASANSSDAF
jgi:broad specificity phosphatase PhoE